MSQRRNTTKPNAAFHNQLRSESKIEIISLCTITKILIYSLTVPGQQQDKVFERFRIRYSFMIHLSKQKPVDSLVTPLLTYLLTIGLVLIAIMLYVHTFISYSRSKSKRLTTAASASFPLGRIHAWPPHTDSAS